MSRCPTEGSKVAESQKLPVLVLEGILKHLTVPKVTKERPFGLYKVFLDWKHHKSEKETIYEKSRLVSYKIPTARPSNVVK